MLWPTPGKWEVTLFLLVKMTLATGLLAELGFLGVTILGLLTTPFFWGHCFKAGATWWAFFFNLTL